ncbi:hypothetical protein [Pseudomonas sp. LP_7_YM]|uniref:hypothetical protein n=1 Tax=Pseudomonas sp. LP_7_YM TaxID=2485137 RepID=UPI00105D5D6F|nr:hypothetical protein [Pseudomonas sp. LP_7_YM]TDV61244.1 hypothetical protein EC915_10931 [Pseudomonas sp. LP_7_YM]
MARQLKFQIANVEYGGTTAPAKAQEEMLHLSVNVGLISFLSEKNPSGDAELVLALLRAPFEALQRLAALALRNGAADLIMRDDGQGNIVLPIGPNLFQDNIQYYYLLVAYVLRENLKGFFELLPQSAGEQQDAA